MVEALVVLQMLAGQPGSDAAARVREQFEVAAALPPRLLVVRTGDGDLGALRATPGVAAAVTDPAALRVEPPLSEAETLFAAGWAARDRPKARSGDGLAWDAPGFEAPGGPRR